MGFDWGQAATGFLGGGPIGGAIGGFFPGAGPEQNKELDELYKQLSGSAQGYDQRQAPQAQYQAAADSSFRGNQENLVAQLERQARGEGPSVAAQQLKAATDQNTSTQAALAASSRGNPNLAQFQAANNASAIGQGAAQSAALGRVQEQLGAMGQLGGVLQGARGQDLGLNTFNSGQQNNNNQFNASAQLQQTGMNDQSRQAAYQQALAAMQERRKKGLPGTGDQILGGAGQALSFVMGNPGVAAGNGYGGQVAA